METMKLTCHHWLKKINATTLMTLFIFMLFATVAWAIPVPVAGSFAYDAYDIAVNQILNGPIGFVLGVLAIGFGAWAAMRTEIIMAISAVLGGAVLLSADTVVASLGMII